MVVLTDSQIEALRLHVMAKRPHIIGVSEWTWTKALNRMPIREDSAARILAAIAIDP
jgi:hypothetical protein